MPPNIMDFEASGFGAHGYPIEVGYCLDDGEKFCTLIRPDQSWTFWDQEAERLHGVSRPVLTNSGMGIIEVATELNRRLEGKTLYSDGWGVDQRWLTQMYEIAGIAPNFKLRAIEHIQSECQYYCWDEVKAQVVSQSELKRHRASLDAQLIQKIYEKTQAHCSSV